MVEALVRKLVYLLYLTIDQGQSLVQLLPDLVYEASHVRGVAKERHQHWRSNTNRDDYYAMGVVSNVFDAR